ncbi:MAG: hypothetical protein WC943_07310 [Elusimicrobiota bacterium]|jgi:hypothetical protein
MSQRMTRQARAKPEQRAVFEAERAATAELWALCLSEDPDRGDAEVPVQLSAGDFFGSVLAGQLEIFGIGGGLGQGSEPCPDPLDAVQKTSHEVLLASMA